MDFNSPWAGKSYQKCNISPEWLYSLLPHFQWIVVNCVWRFVSRKQTYSSTVLRVFWWTIWISLCLVREKTWKNIASYEIVILIRDALLNIMACVYILEIFLFFSWCFVLAKTLFSWKLKVPCWILSSLRSRSHWRTMGLYKHSYPHEKLVAVAW